MWQPVLMSLANGRKFETRQHLCSHNPNCSTDVTLHIHTVILQHLSYQWFNHCLDCSSICLLLKIQDVSVSRDWCYWAVDGWHQQLLLQKLPLLSHPKSLWFMFVSAVSRRGPVSQIKTCLKEITVMTALVGAGGHQAGCNIQLSK